MSRRLPRRTILRGLGAAVSLPWLDAMGPAVGWAAAPEAAGKSPTATTPNRLAFVYVPNGVNVENWFPKTEGFDYELTPGLEPLKHFRHDLCVLTGLTADKA